MFNMVEAIMQYGASDKLTGDAWKTLVENVQKTVADGGVVVEVLKNAEAEFKERTKKPLPSAWRSAKSVVLRAYEKGINLTDEQGVVGKTAVEKMLKESKEPANSADKVRACMERVAALIESEERPVSSALVCIVNEYTARWTHA